MAQDKTRQIVDKAEDQGRKLGHKLADEAEGPGRELANKAGDKGQELGRELANKAGDKGREFIGKAGPEAREKLWELWGERPSQGELSEQASAMLDSGAKVSSVGAEAAIERGTQLAPVAADVAKTLVSAVDSERMIEPVVQDLADEKAQAELDAKIADMPRVETIDGVEVGFKELIQTDTAGRTTESSYLILWRKDDKLLGLVYRSKQRVHVDKIIEEAPRLLKLVGSAL